jgi:membrane protease YdiL (CAAX protease family)
MGYLATAVVFTSALAHICRWNRFRERSNLQWFSIHLAISTFFFALPPHSAVSSFGRSLTLIIALWPLLLPQAPASLIHGGPLGRGCAKACEVLAACLLWIGQRGELPPLQLGPWPDAFVLVIVFAISAAVNLVLWAWSQFFASRGNHEGVNELVKTLVGRRLRRKEHIRMIGLAIANAVCEEVMSRGFWRSEFARSIDPPLTDRQSNFLQAIVFGVWHYHGIPSGVPGVILTFIYGLVMGQLMDYGHGLLLPIIAHTLADYFIFAIIARQNHDKKDT